MGEIAQTQSLSLENALQRREVNDSQLSEQTARDGVIKHLVVEDTNLACKNGFAGGATGQCIEHIEENEAGEGHGCVAGGNEVVGGHFEVVGCEGAEHDDGGGLEDALDEWAG